MRPGLTPSYLYRKFLGSRGNNPVVPSLDVISARGRNLLGTAVLCSFFCLDTKEPIPKIFRRPRQAHAPVCGCDLSFFLEPIYTVSQSPCLIIQPNQALSKYSPQVKNPVELVCKAPYRRLKNVRMTDPREWGKSDYHVFYSSTFRFSFIELNLQ